MEGLAWLERDATQLHGTHPGRSESPGSARRCAQQQHWHLCSRSLTDMALPRRGGRGARQHGEALGRREEAEGARSHLMAAGAAEPDAHRPVKGEAAPRTRRMQLSSRTPLTATARADELRESSEGEAGLRQEGLAQPYACRPRAPRSRRLREARVHDGSGPRSRRRPRQAR